MFEYRTEQVGDLVVRIRVPNQEGFYPVLLLLHGWTGNENSMWVFESRFPNNAVIVALRGIYPSPFGGYGWQKNTGERWPNLNDFQTAINLIMNFIFQLHITK